MMHQKLCSIILLSALATAALALQQHSPSPPNQDDVNVLLEPSCWTSDSCRREFKARFNATVLQLRVPWQVIYPTFNGPLIWSAVQDMQTASNTVEPLFIFENQVEVAHLHGIAHELSNLQMPRSAFLLDSRDATENLAVITKELSIIHTVFRRQPSPTFYNVPPSSFLSTKHLHKYLRYVRKHVTGIRLPVSDSNLSAESLDEILTVISENSLVPQVEVKGGNASALLAPLLAHHNVTVVFAVVGREDLLEALPRPRRSLGGGGFNWNAAFNKASSPLQAAPPAVPWSERRANAKRNLIKLFGSMANSKKDTQAALKESKLLSLAKKATPGGATPEQRIFVSSENPRFPNEDIAFSLSDRRGDLAAKRDFEYVEYGPKDASLARDLSSEKDEETRELSSPRKKHHGTGKKPTSLELWERGAQASPLRSYNQDGNLRLYREEDVEAHPVSGFQLKAGPQYYVPEENFTVGGQYFYPEQRRLREERRRHRMRRDIFGQEEPSLFHDIRDNYPKMLERLAGAMRPEALPQVSLLHEEDHISNLLDSQAVRKTRSSPFFIHEDPTLNEIPYNFPVPAVTLPPIIEPRIREGDGSSVASLVDILMDGWHTLKNHLQNFFW